MGRKLLLAGMVSAALGLALYGNYSLGGPTFPRSPAGVLGWAFLLGGLAAMKAGAGRDGR
ncbi:MAG: hypothetical protein ABEJ26_11125 [Halosimplex sp.]